MRQELCLVLALDCLGNQSNEKHIYMYVHTQKQTKTPSPSTHSSKATKNTTSRRPRPTLDRCATTQPPRASYRKNTVASVHTGHVHSPRNQRHKPKTNCTQQADRQAGRQKDRQTDRQTERQTKNKSTQYGSLYETRNDKSGIFALLRPKNSLGRFALSSLPHHNDLKSGAYQPSIKKRGTFYRNISRTSAVSSTNFGSILIFASCVVAICVLFCVFYVQY